MSLNNILLEGRKDDFLSKFSGKFTNEELKNIFLLSRDLASNHKFLMFLGDALESGNIKYDVAKDIIEKFIKYQKVLPTKDIYLFKSLSAIQDEINSHENKVRRNVKELEGADQVYERPAESLSRQGGFSTRGRKVRPAHHQGRGSCEP